MWHGCDLYVLPGQLPGQNENGILFWMGFCPGAWMGYGWGFARAHGWGFAWASRWASGWVFAPAWGRCSIHVWAKHIEASKIPIPPSMCLGKTPYPDRCPGTENPIQVPGQNLIQMPAGKTPSKCPGKTPSRCPGKTPSRCPGKTPSRCPGKTHPDARAKPHPDARAKPHPDARAKPHPDARAKPHPDARAKPHPDARAKPHPDARIQMPGQNTQAMPGQNLRHDRSPFQFCPGKKIEVHTHFLVSPHPPSSFARAYAWANTGQKPGHFSRLREYPSIRYCANDALPISPETCSSNTGGNVMSLFTIHVS